MTYPKKGTSSSGGDVYMDVKYPLDKLSWGELQKLLTEVKDVEGKFIGALTYLTPEEDVNAKEKFTTVDLISSADFCIPPTS